MTGKEREMKDMKKRAATIVAIVAALAAALAAVHLVVSNWDGIIEAVRKMHGGS
jgi:hypothetical protein